MSISWGQSQDVNSVDTVRVVMRGLARVGLEPEPELRKVGAEIVDGKPRGGLSRAAYCALWQRMSRASGRDDFGLHFASQVEAGVLGPLEWLATTAKTLGDGLGALASCGRLLHTGGHYGLERRGDEAAFVYYASGVQPCRSVIDWGFGYLLRAAGRVTADPLRPKVVRVQYARPSDAARVEAAFGAPVVFDAPLNEIVFAREQLDMALTTHDDEAHTTLASLCRSRCEVATEGDLRLRVKTHVLRHLEREELPSLADIARGLGMSARSLQRGLSAEDLSYRQLVLDARMELADRWLTDPRRSIGEVAYALGYSEPSALHRAYRNHFGRPCRTQAAA